MSTDRGRLDWSWNRFVLPIGRIVHVWKFLRRSWRGHLVEHEPKEPVTAVVTGWRYVVLNTSRDEDGGWTDDSRRLVVLVRRGLLNREEMAMPDDVVPIYGETQELLPLLAGPWQEKSWKEWMREVCRHWPRDEKGQWVRCLCKEVSDE